MLGNRRYCYPLTVTDFASRYLLACEALSTTQRAYAFTVFERIFKDYGLPRAIRTDNGVPFASAHALYGLSKLSVWWLRLGIRPRAHQARASRAERPARADASDAEDSRRPSRPRPTCCSSRPASIAFIEGFNEERPHQALGDARARATLYAPVSRPYRGLGELDYPLHDWTGTVTHCGRICFKGRK